MGINFGADAVVSTMTSQRTSLIDTLAGVRLADVDLVPGEAMDDVQAFRFAGDLVTQGEYARAVKLLEPLAARLVETSVRELLGRAYYGRAQLGPAERVFRALTEDFPDDPYAHHALARTLARQSRHDEAAAHRRLAGALSED